MNLPNYFLADLPPEATLTAAMLEEACQTLKRNREQYLAQRSTESLVNVLATLGEHWLRPDYPFRKLALEQGAAATSFSRATLANGLDAFFKEFTHDHFLALLEQDLGHRQKLDQLNATQPEQQSHRASIATGPEFLVHITAGKLPNPALMSITLGLLARSAQFVKCASGTSLLPRLFAHSLYEVEPKLAACLELAEWRGGDTNLENVLFEHADCLTATGTNETLIAIRQRLPFNKRFIGYGHKVSFAYVSSGILTGLNARKLAATAAADVVAWDQLGCLSPHVIFIEKGGAVPAELFAEMLAEDLERREATEPRGQLAVEVSGAIASRRSMYELRAAHARSNPDPEYPVTRIWGSPNSTAWTVIYESDPRFQLSCLHRFIYVKEVTNLSEALRNADSVRGKVSTVGLAAPDEELPSKVRELARWGVSRVCPLGEMQKPPITWRHDGRPALGELVTWTDWERNG